MKHMLRFSLIALLALAAMPALAQTVTLTIQETHLDGDVSVSFDDGEYENDSIDKLDDDDLDMGWEGEDLNIMTTFLRYRDVQIPQGATILSAVLTIYAHEDEADEAIITVYGEATDSTVSFTETEALADRDFTTASVPWVCSDSWTMWQPYSSPDLSVIIQEIVNRAGWVAGNPLTIFLQGEDQGASLLDNARDFESYENIEDPDDGGDGLHHPERIPTLVITYTTAGVEDVKQVAVSVYPNPAINHNLEIQLAAPIQGEASLHSMDGKCVQRMAISGQSMSMDISTLPKGVYVLKVSDGTIDRTQQVIIP